MNKDLSEKLKKTFGEIVLTNRIMETIKDLCLLGSRFAGTDSEIKAQEYIKQYLENIDVPAKEFEFEYQGWERGTCELLLTEPIKTVIPAISLVLGPSTTKEGLQIEIINGEGGSNTEISQLDGKIKGKALMVHSGETLEGWLHRRIKYGNAYEKGAKAFIFANHNPGQLFPTGSVRPNRIGEIPALGISKENYEYIKELSKKNQVMSSITMQNHYSTKMSKHLIWEIEGEIKDEYIIIGGHYDGHDLAQGATDNAGSIAILLEITQLMKEQNIKPKYSIRFMAFGVEEFGVVGSTIYTDNTDLSDVKFMINVDGIVGHIQKCVACNGLLEVLTFLHQIEKQFPFEISITNNIVVASDNYPFFTKGIPCVAIYSQNPLPSMGRGYGHTSADTFDKISKLDAKVSVIFVMSLLRIIADSPELPGRVKKNKIKSILQDANLEKHLKLLEKWPFD